MKLNIDYVSDIHLGFYVSKNKDLKLIRKFVDEKIKSQANSPILVIAGDIDEDIDIVCEFLYSCSKYYDKTIFIAGNHEYYIPNIRFIYEDEAFKKYNSNSMNKIYELNNTFSNNNDIIFLDKTNKTNGIYNYNGFKIAGDTLWYKPEKPIDWLYYYPMQNDSSFIMSNLNKKRKILKLNSDSINWYSTLPNDLDLLITHIPPFINDKNKDKNNCCYHTEVDEFKSPIWIYGHDHIENDITINDTRFLSNPWGYKQKEFKIKTYKLQK